MTDATRDHNRVSPQGRALGEQLVRLTDPAVQKLADLGEPDERCKSCAFRLGTVPNGCLQTQADAFKAVIEGVPFLCHQTDRLHKLCHGWFAARNALNEAEKVRGPPKRPQSRLTNHTGTPMKTIAIALSAAFLTACGTPAPRCQDSLYGCNNQTRTAAPAAAPSPAPSTPSKPDAGKPHGGKPHHGKPHGKPGHQGHHGPKGQGHGGKGGRK